MPDPEADGSGEAPQAEGDAMAGSDTGGVDPVDGGVPVAEEEPPPEMERPDAGGAAEHPRDPRTLEAGCLADVDAYFEPGPFDHQETETGRIRILVPEVPAGCKVPMIHFSTGTGAPCENYGDVLRGLAGHGFLTLCYEGGTTGDGSHGVQAFETALAEYPELADLRFGLAGHGAGGQGAFVGQQLSEARWGAQGVYAGFGAAPESGFGTQPEGGTWSEVYAEVRAPVFMFSGAPSDGLVSMRWVQQGFGAFDDGTEAYHFSRTDLVHIPVPQGVVLQLAVPWFRWKLLGDQDACRALMSIPEMDDEWLLADSHGEVPCGD